MVKRFTYYLKLYWLSVSRAFMTELEYRLNFLVSIANTFFSFATTLIFFKVIYLQVDRLGAWRQDEIILLLGIYLLVTGVFEATIRKGLDRLPRYVARGSFDITLLRPANSIFQVTVWRLDLDDLVKVILAGLTLSYAWQRLALTFGPANLLGFVVVLLSGLLTLYANYLLIMTTTFWVVRVYYQDIYKNLLQMMRLPLDLYDRRMQTLFTYVVPLAFFIFFPTKALLGTLPLWLFFFAPIWAAFNFFLAVKFWNFALRYYSSASS